MDGHRIGIVSEQILGVSYRIGYFCIGENPILCAIIAGSAAVNVSYYTERERVEGAGGGGRL